MKIVLHYRLYMCKPFSNPAILTKNVNQKFQYTFPNITEKVCMIICFFPQQLYHQMQVLSNLMVDVSSLQKLYSVSKRLIF